MLGKYARKILFAGYALTMIIGGFGTPFMLYHGLEQAAAMVFAGASAAHDGAGLVLLWLGAFVGVSVAGRQVDSYKAAFGPSGEHPNILDEDSGAWGIAHGTTVVLAACILFVGRIGGQFSDILYEGFLPSLLAYGRGAAYVFYFDMLYQLHGKSRHLMA